MPHSAEISTDATQAAPGPDPLVVLNTWYAEACDRGDVVPDAMTLATASLDGRPSARIVLFKGIQRGGVFFVTNYRSRKARELEQNPQAALVMHFAARERQVRIEGRVERATAQESNAYFDSRPRGSRIGAWSSPQSQVIASRAELDELLARTTERFGEGPIARPEFWGGYLLFPEQVELWLGRPDRLHDRFLYRPVAGGSWSIERLAP